MILNWIVALQVSTFIILSVAFAIGGNWRLGIAQFCYAIATAALFTK